MKKFLNVVSPREPAELFTIIIVLVMAGIFITGCGKDKSDSNNTESVKSTIKITLPDEPNGFNSPRYMNIEEVCLNGFVYYIGNANQKSAMAPKYISPTAIEICKE